MVDNYQQLLERISNAAKVGVEDIERKVEAKRAKLSGLVSKEGAAQIVAAELGINFEKEKMKISELVDGMKKANILGKIVQIFPVREFNKNGKEGKVVNMVVADPSSNVKAVLWDTNHISLIETGKIKEGDVIEISNASVRSGELHLSSFSDIKHSKEKLDNVVTEKVFAARTLRDAKSGQGIKTRAIIVQVFEPRYFEVCPECGKRAVEGQCQIHGAVKPNKRALLNLVLDDGTETIRAVLFAEAIKKLGIEDEILYSIESFIANKDKILGEERWFTGMIKNNQLYNTLEFNVEQVDEVDVNSLLNELEAKG